MALISLWDHPKFLHLIHMLQEPLPYVVGYLECLWRVGYQTCNPMLGDVLHVEVAAHYPGPRGKLCQALLDAGFLDVKDGQYWIHDLMEHAPRYVRERMRKRGWRKKAHGGAKMRPVAPPPPDPPPPDPTRRKGEESPLTPSCSEPAITPASEPNTTQETSLFDLRDLEILETRNVPKTAGEDDRVVMVFPAVGKVKDWNLYASKLAQWQETFPGLDVAQECRRAWQWCQDNPAKRKTARGMSRFLYVWLSNSQDRLGVGDWPRKDPVREQVNAASIWLAKRGVSEAN